MTAFNLARADTEILEKLKKNKKIDIKTQWS